ncbi:hypothetical protein [Roseofilum casamattae]|uniref:Uncharacterized protein n=1 Tax=Roseofilum casamattae BLCC-M143 TaxID=3022442 RepID=A0ABT7BR45_9CYAN|nr:hypothetical protein [Roseofilum casamattae]MDJ1181660.1 hypothetical protein [Roseofilum casamattae BLCC-M143]
MRLLSPPQDLSFSVYQLGWRSPFHPLQRVKPKPQPFTDDRRSSISCYNQAT